MSMQSVRRIKIKFPSGQTMIGRRATLSDWDAKVFDQNGKLQHQSIALTSTLETLARLGSKRTDGLVTDGIKLGKHLPHIPSTPVVDAVKQAIVDWLKDCKHRQKLELTGLSTKDINTLAENVLFARARAHRAQPKTRKSNQTQARLNAKTMHTRTS